MAEQVMVWDEWGCPFDARGVLPAREYQALLAVLQGRNEKRREEAAKAERAAKQAGRR